jgi:hypothetical protein
MRSGGTDVEVRVEGLQESVGHLAAAAVAGAEDEYVHVSSGYRSKCLLLLVG